MSAAVWMWMAWGGMAGAAGLYGWAWAKTGKKGRAWLEWGLVAFVAGVSLASALTHEPWRDETHAWLLARDWGAWELLGQMRYEGHFALWHLLLHPFARLGAGMVWSGVISWAINAATVAWFVRKVPLGGWAKAASALSCVFLYVNPSISRCYVLVPPLLFGLAALWEKRDERPIAFGVLAALLANTHLYMEGTAGLLFLVYAWENVFRRSDGKGWRECGRQLVGLGLMGAGICGAMAQMVPGLWDHGICYGGTGNGWKADLGWFLQGFGSWIGLAGAVAGLVWLGVEAWRRDKGLFVLYAGSFAYMAGFSVSLYPAHVLNRALLWWPVALGTAWVLGRRNRAGEGKGLWLTAAVALAGTGLMRPDMTWLDWRREYDPLQGACRYIEERYGRDAEVWVNGGDLCTEVASAYLDHLMDWRTGGRTERFSMAVKAQKPVPSFQEFRDLHFLNHPGEESVLVLGSTAPWSGLGTEDATGSDVQVEYLSLSPLCPLSHRLLVMRARRGDPAENGTFWLRTGVELLEKGEPARAVAAWNLAVLLDGRQWEAMNNLAWVFAKAGRAAEARAWMDRAMGIEEARENAGVWDTEATVRRAEGNEEGAREAEEVRDRLRGSR